MERKTFCMQYLFYNLEDIGIHLFFRKDVVFTLAPALNFVNFFVPRFCRYDRVVPVIQIAWLIPRDSPLAQGRRFYQRGWLNKATAEVTSFNNR